MISAQVAGMRKDAIQNSAQLLWRPSCGFSADVVALLWSPAVVQNLVGHPQNYRERNDTAVQVRSSGRWRLAAVQLQRALACARRSISPLSCCAVRLVTENQEQYWLSARERAKGHNYVDVCAQFTHEAHR
jgi:hypothetical protein